MSVRFEQQLFIGLLKPKLPYSDWWLDVATWTQLNHELCLSVTHSLTHTHVNLMFAYSGKIYGKSWDTEIKC